MSLPNAIQLCTQCISRLRQQINLHIRPIQEHGKAEHKSTVVPGWINSSTIQESTDSPTDFSELSNRATTRGIHIPNRDTFDASQGTSKCSYLVRNNVRVETAHTNHYLSTLNHIPETFRSCMPRDGQIDVPNQGITLITDAIPGVLGIHHKYRSKYRNNGSNRLYPCRHIRRLDRLLPKCDTEAYKQKRYHGNGCGDQGVFFHGAILA